MTKMVLELILRQCSKMLNDIRCVKCNALLFKAYIVNGTIEIQCRKCNYKDTFNMKNNKLLRDKLVYA